VRSIEPGPLPTFLGIGAEKAGSTWLDHCLRSHPQCFLPETKEVNFFNRYGSDLDVSDRFDRCGVEWYRAFFRDASPSHKAVGEITPIYMSDPEAPTRIADVVPDVRIVAILRDPVTRAHSHYRMIRHKSRSSGELRSFIELQDARIIGRGRYVHHLRRFAELFGRERIFLMSFEQATAAPREHLARLAQFLDLAPEGFAAADLTAPVNAAARNRSAVVYRLGVKLAGSLWMSPHTVPIARLLKRSGVYAAVKSLNRVRAEPFPLEPEMRIRLADLYAEDNQALSKEFGIDVSAWTTPASARDGAANSQ